MSTPSFLRRLATPASIATFAVLGTTGVLLFFEIAEREIKDLHQWLGLVFVGVTVLHVARNWATFRAYLRGKAAWVFFALTLAFVATAVIPKLMQGEQQSGIRVLLDRLGKAPLDEVAPVLGMTPAELQQQLMAAGFKVDATTSSLSEIAKASGREPREALEAAAPRPSALPPAAP